MSTNETRIYTCPHCHKKFELTNNHKSGGFMSSHRRFCEYNPKRQWYLDTIKASAFKASKIGNDIKRKKYLSSLQDYKFTCERCGNVYTKTFSPKQYQQYLKRHHFCSKSCSSARTHTLESRLKISTSLKKRHNICRPHPCELRKTSCVCCGSEILVKTTGETTCYSCREAHPEIKKYSLYSSDGKRITSSSTKMKISKRVKEQIAAGTHKGWISRNIVSYPEIFWKKVLDNNGIKYSFNFPIKKTDLGFSDNACYFLDFKIGENIDLEIDGRQHLMYDRKQHDEDRDAALTAHGYIVYRVPWNEINTEEGSKMMKDKIDTFIKWYYQKIQS